MNTEALDEIAKIGAELVTLADNSHRMTHGEMADALVGLGTLLKRYAPRPVERGDIVDWNDGSWEVLHVEDGAAMLRRLGDGHKWVVGDVEQLRRGFVR